METCGRGSTLGKLRTQLIGAKKGSARLSYFYRMFFDAAPPSETNTAQISCISSLVRCRATSIVSLTFYTHFPEKF